MDKPEKIFNEIIDKEQEKYDKARMKYIKTRGINNEFSQYGFSIFNQDSDNSNWDILGPDNDNFEELDNNNIKTKRKNIRKNTIKNIINKKECIKNI